MVKKITYKNEYIPYCPKCNSTNIIGGKFVEVPLTQQCTNCGYYEYSLPQIKKSEVKNLGFIKKMIYKSESNEPKFDPMYRIIIVFTGILLIYSSISLLRIRQEFSLIILSLIGTILGVYIICASFIRKNGRIFKKKH